VAEYTQKKAEVAEIKRSEPPKTDLKSSDSFTEEDLIETLQDIKAVVDLLLHRAKCLQQLVY